MAGDLGIRSIWFGLSATKSGRLRREVLTMLGGGALLAQHGLLALQWRGSLERKLAHDFGLLIHDCSFGSI